MEKEQVEQLLEMFEELNGYLEAISSRMGGIENTLDLMLKELKAKERRRRSPLG